MFHYNFFSFGGEHKRRKNCSAGIENIMARYDICIIVLCMSREYQLRYECIARSSGNTTEQTSSAFFIFPLLIRPMFQWSLPMIIFIIIIYFAARFLSLLPHSSVFYSYVATIFRLCLLLCYFLKVGKKSGDVDGEKMLIRVDCSLHTNMKQEWTKRRKKHKSE